MTVNCIFLNYLRKEHTQGVQAQNFHNAGHPFDVVEIDMLGIAAAINAGIDLSRGYDAVYLMSNDILLPDGWLARSVQAATAIANTGMAAIHCVEQLPPVQEINGVLVHPHTFVFGNVLIPWTAIAKVGYWNTVYDPYGMQDSDYSYRLHSTGHLNYYLHGLTANHIGHDGHLKTDYRRMKDEGLMRCASIWEQTTRQYEESGIFTIDMPEYP